VARSALAIVVVMLLGGVAAFYHFRLAQAKSAVDPPPEGVYPELRMVGNTVTAPGTVRLQVGAEVRVGSQLSGIVKKLYVTVGSHVEADQVIAEIDDTSIRAKVAQAEAQAELDQVAMEQVALTAKRDDQLGSQGLIPLQQQQDADLAFKEAKAKYDKSLRDLDVARVDLGYVQVRTPISGTVATVSTQEGETVASAFATPTFVTIIRDNSLELVAAVDETDIAAVKPGNPVSFTVDSYPSMDFPGAVESIAPKAVASSGNVAYEVTIGIRKNANLLKPDMTANVSIATAQHKALVVPSRTVQRDGQQAVLYVQSPNGPERRPVVTGAKDGADIEIRKGISVGDKILLVPSG